MEGQKYMWFRGFIIPCSFPHVIRVFPALVVRKPLCPRSKQNDKCPIPLPSQQVTCTLQSQEVLKCWISHDLILPVKRLVVITIIIATCVFITLVWLCLRGNGLEWITVFSPTSRLAYESFRLPSVRLRLDSTRLRRAFQFAYVLSFVLWQSLFKTVDSPTWCEESESVDLIRT